MRRLGRGARSRSAEIELRLATRPRNRRQRFSSPRLAILAKRRMRRLAIGRAGVVRVLACRGRLGRRLAARMAGRGGTDDQGLGQLIGIESSRSDEERIFGDVLVVAQHAGQKGRLRGDQPVQRRGQRQIVGLALLDSPLPSLPVRRGPRSGALPCTSIARRLIGSVRSIKRSRGGGVRLANTRSNFVR